MKIQNLKWFVLVMLMFALVACGGGGGSSRPTVAVTSMSSSTPTDGQIVTLQVSAIDAKGIAEIELTEGADMLAEANITPPQKTVMAPLTWRASAGQHTLTVRSLNQDSMYSDPVTIAMNVAPAPAPTIAPAPTAAPVPTIAPNPQPTPPPAPTQPPQPGPCTNVAQFVADVTVPDGTQWMPNQSFNKIWRVKNGGTCTWTTKYQLVFASGEAMTGLRAMNLANNVAPGQTIDLLVTMGAPATGGSHSGIWQIKDESGATLNLFLKVAIVTVLPQPTACIPTIQYFNADHAVINRGQSTTLMWGLVGNANRAEIDQGIGGITTPGFKVVSPQQTTTYTLSAYCGATLRQARVTVSVNQPVQPTPVPPTPVPPAPPTQVPVVRRNVTGTWNAGVWSVQLNEALGCSSAQCEVAGTLTHGVLPAPSIFEVQGTINVNTGAISFSANIPGGVSFNGTVSADSRTMSGTLSSVGSLTFTK
ncbi:MAG: hypothetical protein HY868_19835 [Chloroflexi bacterium]|nr:hypothetical protein [Chloroflexota bacterium]